MKKFTVHLNIPLILTFALVLNACATSPRCNPKTQYAVNGQCARNFSGERAERTTGNGFNPPSAVTTRRGAKTRPSTGGVSVAPRGEALMRSSPVESDIDQRLDALEEEQFFNSMEIDRVLILNHFEP